MDEHKYIINLLHDQQTGYYFDRKFSDFVDDIYTKNWIKGYISAITDFMSNPKYLCLKSVSAYFSTDQFFVFFESEPNKDERYCWNGTITLFNDCSDSDFKAYINENINKKSHELDEKERSEFLFSLLAALVQRDTDVYCLVDDDLLLSAIKTEFFSQKLNIIRQCSYIEAIGNIPDVESTLFLCRCTSDEDKIKFERKIRNNYNYIMHDFTCDKFKSQFELKNSNYAQSVILELGKYFSYEEIVKRFSQVVNSIIKKYGKITPNDTFYNFVCALMVANFFESSCKDIIMTDEEKNEIMKVFFS